MSAKRDSDDELRELLPELVLGTLAPEDEARVRAGVQRSAELERELATWEHAIAQLSLVLPPVPPSPGLWERINDSVARPRPYAAMAGRLAAALQLGAAAVNAMLDRIDLASSWVAGPSESSKLFHIEPGPAIVAAGGLAGFVKVEAGAHFPAHLHQGGETVIVLSGGFRDDDGRIYRAGDVAYRPAGSKHAFDVLPGEELVCLAVLEGGGIDFGSGFSL